MSKLTAILEGDNDKQMMGYGRVQEKDGETFVSLPHPIVNYMEKHLDFATNGFEIYHNDDGCVVIGAAEDGRDVKMWDDTFWVRVTDEMDAIRPLDNSTCFPVVILGCGEVWLLNHDTFFQKVAAEADN